jgi:hypothetical protein
VWTTYDDADRQIAVARWEERGLSVVFPIAWAHDRGQRAMIRHATARVAEVEGQVGQRLMHGSVLRAFGLDDFAPEVPRGLIIGHHRERTP